MKLAYSDTKGDGSRSFQDNLFALIKERFADDEWMMMGEEEIHWDQVLGLFRTLSIQDQMTLIDKATPKVEQQQREPLPLFAVRLPVDVWVHILKTVNNSTIRNVLAADEYLYKHRLTIVTRIGNARHGSPIWNGPYFSDFPMETLMAYELMYEFQVVRNAEVSFEFYRRDGSPGRLYMTRGPGSPEFTVQWQSYIDRIVTEMLKDAEGEGVEDEPRTKIFELAKFPIQQIFFELLTREGFWISDASSTIITWGGRKIRVQRTVRDLSKILRCISCSAIPAIPNACAACGKNVYCGQSCAEQHWVEGGHHKECKKK